MSVEEPVAGSVEVPVEINNALEFSGVRQILRVYLTGALSEPVLERLWPGTDPDRIREDLAQAGEAMAYLREESPPSPARLSDPRPLLARLKVKSVALEPLELLHLAGLARLAYRVSRLFDAKRFPRLAAAAGQLPDLRELAQAVEGKILPDGTIDSSAGPALKRIRQQVERTRRRVEKALGDFIQRHQKDKLLQDAVVSIHNDRFVVPIKAGGKRKLGGIVHGTSSSGASVFMEPLETVALNNERVELQEKEWAEIRRLLRAWSDRFRERREELAQATETLGELDLVMAKGRFGREYDCCLPELVIDRDGGREKVRRLVLEKARHPLLEKTLRAHGRKPVPVSLELVGPKTLMIISGPNAGGKTVVLKTVGLLALMAQAGMPVPAEQALLPVFDRIRVDIGDQQSIEQSLSTFSAHLANLQSMVTAVTKRDLILLDEVGGSTDPAEGAALAEAVLDYFRQHGALTFATTHHTRLKTYATETAEAVNAGMEFDQETLQPTYRLLVGVPGKSSGIDVSARLGLEPAIVEKARTLVSSTEAEVSRLLESLHAARQKAERLERELEEKQQQLEAREKFLEQEYRRDRRRRLAALEAKLEEALKDYEQRFRAEVEKLRMQAATINAKAVPPPVRKASTLKKEAQTDWQAQVEAELGTADFSAGTEVQAGVGDRVRIRGVTTPGAVTAVSEDDQLEVEVGSFRMRVKRSEIEEVKRVEEKRIHTPEFHVEKAVVPEAQPVKSEKGSERPGSELHVRGMYVEEARELVDKFLDCSVLEGHATVAVVHGKGTGALRRALSEMFAAHLHVAAFQSAAPEHGGDGVTVVTLRTS